MFVNDEWRLAQLCLAACLFTGGLADSCGECCPWSGVDENVPSTKSLMNGARASGKLPQGRKAMNYRLKEVYPTELRIHAELYGTY